jgi:hypothetical protein
MLLKLAIAALMLVVTTGVHAGAMILAMHAIKSQGGRLRQRLLRIRNYLRVAEIVILMFLASVVEVLVWAATYLAVNAIQGFEKALYFSMVTFTTLGYGEIVLEERWRLLSSFEAANGILMFGWSTAIVIAAVQRVYFSEIRESHEHAGSGA